MDIDIEEKSVCYGCIGERFLSSKIEIEDNLVTCSYCDYEEIPGCSLRDLAEMVDVAFEQHYDRMSEDLPDDWPLEWIKNRADDWEPDGSPVIYAIMDAVNTSEEIASDIQQILEGKHYSRSSAEIGETSDFHDGSFYDTRSPDDSEWEKKWFDFEESLKNKTRFFSRNAFEHLHSVFQHIEHFKTHDKNPVVKIIGHDSDIEILYRARAFQSDSGLKSALELPHKELGPPPSSFAKAGRMNASGISVFYGATNSATALAEIRPPVGSNVIVAKFQIKRKLKVLDLSALSYTVVKGSIFDTKYVSILSRTSFLRKLSQRMTKAVMPDDEHFEYLPTQAISDFLASEMGFDGIIFPSAQSESGYNVALFNHAARVEEITYPKDSEIQASLSDWEDDMEIQSYSVRAKIPEYIDDPEKAVKDPWDLACVKLIPQDSDKRLVTISVDKESIVVEHIKSVVINSESFSVDYWEYKIPVRFSSTPSDRTLPF